MGDDKEKKAAEPAKASGGGVIGKVIGGVFAAVIAPVLVTVGIKWADPDRWDRWMHGTPAPSHQGKDHPGKEKESKNPAKGPETQHPKDNPAHAGPAKPAPETKPEPKQPDTKPVGRGGKGK